MNAPTPPEDVTVHLDDRTAIAVDCRYLGTDPNGTHQWEVIWNRPPIEATFLKVTVGLLPPHTAIRFPGSTPIGRARP